jgi:hypothetical protein
MSFLAERLSELRRHLHHLRELRPRVVGPEALARDLSLHNDVLFSLLTVCQLVDRFLEVVLRIESER